LIVFLFGDVLLLEEKNECKNQTTNTYQVSKYSINHFKNSNYFFKVLFEF